MERRAVMTWAQRLKRVFNIVIETCKKKLTSARTGLRPVSRAPPANLFD